MKCSLCKSLLKDLGHWIYLKSSYGKIVKGAELRVCESCYRDSIT